MTIARPGERIEAGPHASEIDFAPFRMRVSTERYHSPDFHARERELLWMRVWQVAGRADEIPETGDWMEYRLFDQSYVLVRGRDGVVRGFVNACRHRGNAFCEGKGRAARFTCPYHNWSYGLDGKCLAIAKPDYDGPIEEFVGAPKEELGLIEVPVECFAGFVFLNPDRDAAPLAEHLGEAAQFLAPYHMEEMVPVDLNLRETIECNWKVIIDAFQEGYHIQGIHPELIPAMDESKERYLFFGDHSVATAPFGSANLTDFPPEVQVDGVRVMPTNFPGMQAVMPRFEELVDACRDSEGAIQFGPGVNARKLLQQATREVLTARGQDVSGLTDTQMSDNQFWVLFPNLFITIRAEEATVITAVPHPDGNPGRCIWQVTIYHWLPPEEREAKRTPLRVIPEGGHEPYYFTLEQDYIQMQRQQDGLRNRTLREMALTRQEVRLAHFHATVDSWVAGKAG